MIESIYQKNEKILLHHFYRYVAITNFLCTCKIWVKEIVITQLIRKCTQNEDIMVFEVKSKQKSNKSYSNLQNNFHLFYGKK